MTGELRQRRERRRGEERRLLTDRRMRAGWVGPIRFASWQEQKVQFLTRYLFIVLALLFFNYSPDFTPTWMQRWQMNVSYLVYGVANTFFFSHAWRQPRSIKRYRVAMWLDIVMVSIAVLNDPFAIPPTLIVFIVVVLGNGMRYGMPLFAEGLIGSFVFGFGTLGLRQMQHPFNLGPGMMFLTLFAGIVLIYAYLLMGRIESSRRQLEHSSSTDTLTGLLNRRALFETGELLINKITGAGGRLAVMFADMDKFKSINDTYGHGVGDQVLRELGAILRDSVRSVDVVARYGGDEFVLLLSETSLDDAEIIARRIQERVDACAKERGLDYSVTIGLGEAPDDGATLDAILESVDQALYQCKSENGGGGVRRVARGLRSGATA